MAKKKVLAEDTITEIIESQNSDVQPDINYCARRVKRVVGGEEQQVLCGGALMIQKIEQDGNNAVVTSKCGRCESEETDEYIMPNDIKHSVGCKQAQEVQKKKPTIILATVIPNPIWRCVGIMTDDSRDSVSCDGVVSLEDGGYPF